MTEKLSEKDIQQRLLLYQLLQGQLEELRKQAITLQTKFIEVESTKIAIQDITKLKEANELLIPIGSGIYTTGRALKGNMLVDVGAGILLTKSPEEAEKVLEEKSGEIDGLNNKLQEEMITVIARLNDLGVELQKALQEMQK